MGRCAVVAAVMAVLLGAAPGAAAEEFGPRYVIEQVEVRGGLRTEPEVILRELLVGVGDVVSADDKRVKLSRLRVLALGLFTDVKMALRKGGARGRAVLVIDVIERGTLVLNDIHLGTSESVLLWGGVDVQENNAWGRGVGIGGAFVASTQGRVLRGRPQQAYRLRVSVPRIRGGPLSAAVTLLYNDAAETYRTSGAWDDAAPDHFTAVRHRRFGGIGGLTIELGSTLHLMVEYRLELVRAELPDALVRTFPDGVTRAVDLGLHRGDSWLSTVAAAFEHDTRSDPALPLGGSRLLVSGELSSTAVGSSYEFAKFTVSYQRWFGLPWRHALTVHGYAGLIVGDSPLFDRFYVGDLDPLVPRRALGLTFSTEAAPDFLGSGLGRARWGVLAGRIGVEYLWPLFRGGPLFYGGHLFVGAGAVGLADAETLRVQVDPSPWLSMPIGVYVDAGLRLDTFIGTFNLSLGNLLSRLPL